VTSIVYDIAVGRGEFFGRMMATDGGRGGAARDATKNCCFSGND